MIVCQRRQNPSASLGLACSGKQWPQQLANRTTNGQPHSAIPKVSWGPSKVLHHCHQVFYATFFALSNCEYNRWTGKWIISNTVINKAVGLRFFTRRRGICSDNKIKILRFATKSVKSVTVSVRNFCQMFRCQK